MLIRRESGEPRAKPESAQSTRGISTESPSGEGHPYTVPTRSRGKLRCVPHDSDAYFLDSRLIDGKITRLERTIQELRDNLSEYQRAANQEKDDLHETINSLRADLCTRDKSLSVVCIQLADAQRHADGLIRVNRAHEQKHHCESLYAQGRIHLAAERLLEIVDTVNEDVRANKFIVDWLAGGFRRCALA